MPLWGKLAAATIPLFLAALVSIAWTNSHSMGVQAVLIARLSQDIEHMEQRLRDCPPFSRER